MKKEIFVDLHFCGRDFNEEHDPCNHLIGTKNSLVCSMQGWCTYQTNSTTKATVTIFID